MDPPAYHTLTAATRTITVSGDTSSQIVFNWGSFKGFAQYSDIYQYFIPLRYRVMALANSYVTSSGLAPYAMPQVFAFYPQNYIVETTPAFSTFDAALLSELAGSVAFQSYSRNIGPKISWPNYQ